MEAPEGGLSEAARVFVIGFAIGLIAAAWLAWRYYASS